MRNKKLTLILLLCCGLSVTLINCRHERQVTCADVNFNVTATSTDALLNTSTGTITATASGGTDFQYSLNHGNFQDSGIFRGLAALSDNVIIARNAMGCTDSITVSIGSYNPCAGVVINVTTTKVDAGANQSNGSITASVAGGTGYKFSLNGGTYQTSGTFSNLAAGNYTVAAKSAAGCIGTKQVTIGTVNPCAGITVVVSTTFVQPTINQSNGSITATATGGSGFTYSINNGAYQTSGTFTGLVAGNYTITAKNSNGCLGSKTVALGANNPCAGVTVVVSTTQVNPTTGLSNGSINASATGGTGFTYKLNNGAYQSSGNFTALGVGTYTITAKNANGCLGTKSVTLTATSPCSGVNIAVAANVVHVTPCVTPANNGSITVTASGSTGFTYNVNGGAYQTSNVFAGLNAGTYLIGVKDGNGCTQSTSTAVTLAPKGVTFTQVRSLITNRCSGSGCHINGGSAAGYNFDADCNVVQYWSQINKSCVTYQMSRMPRSPQALFTTAEKQIITNWINAGHRYTD